jgi:uroporphyrinogen-III synthase
MARPKVNLLMTRPQLQAKRFVAQLPVRMLERLTPVFSPLIRIDPVEGDIVLGDARGIIFSSVNGVATAAAKTRRRDLPCFCVGAATAKAAQDAGWRATCRGGTADELIAAMLQNRPDSPLLHLCGAHTRGQIARNLTLRGCETRAQIVYRQNLLPLNVEAGAILRRHDPVIAPLFSPRTARHFAVQGAGPAPLYLLALSETVAQPLRGMGFAALAVAKQPNAAAMISALETIVTQVCRVEGGQSGQ